MTFPYIHKYCFIFDILVLVYQLTQHIIKKTPFLIVFLQDITKLEEHNVIVLVEFAVALMAKLDQINRESFQRFKLRLGEFHINLYFLLQ